jgi:hypothetical protein
MRKKIILFSVFSATVAIMIISVIRVVIVASENQNVEVIWLYFWSVVEVGIGKLLVVIGVNIPNNLQPLQLPISLRSVNFLWRQRVKLANLTLQVSVSA